MNEAFSEMNFVLGSLFPKNSKGKANIQLSSRFEQVDTEDGVVIREKSENDPTKNNNLKTRIDITSNPVKIKNASEFVSNWYEKEITSIYNDDGTLNDSSIFGGVYNKVVNGKWTSWPINRSLKSLVMIGYQGQGSKHVANNNGKWLLPGSKSSNLYQEIKNLDNYDPEALWDQYKESDVVISNYDTKNLRQNLPEGKAKLEDGTEPNIWLPALLYSYGVRGEGTSYPGPVLMTAPGDKIRLKFRNKIKIGNLSKEETQQATLVKNSTYGNGASDGLGGTTSTNYHFHGSHTNPNGFGDNVVSRFTTGQKWTTEIDLPEDHGQGSYWYHPHYHPSVNQQVYGGASGFIQIGDPLAKVPGFKNVPRNLAIIKMMDLGVDKDSGQLQLDAFDGYGGPLTNAMTMVTVNGEFQPKADAKTGGWQSISLSNQTNQAFYNVSLLHQESGERLPLYVYGEDGHQFPKIRKAKGALSQSTSEKTGLITDYRQQKNVVSMAPGKRVDILVYLPEGKTELVSQYNFEGANGKEFAIDNMGGYPDLSSKAKSLTTTDGTPAGATGGQSVGPLAVFNVSDGTSMRNTSQLDREIDRANKNIKVQKVEPSTKPEDYDSNAIPSVNLFETNAKGKHTWKPLRKRIFNWAKETLVGPKNEYDLATRERVDKYNKSVDSADKYKRYETTSTMINTDNPSWFGYEKPFLINDHVFPNGSITIAQLGTMEEWTLRNWSVLNPSKYIGHPFHIHINDYQTKNSDTELERKRSLEDVTMLNSSGYRYVDTSSNATEGDNQKSQAPFRGDFHSIGKNGPNYDANDKTSKVATWGANDQTIRMLYQDYIGTYVFHCHILPHEDAGMMQVITIVENTDSSWIVPAESNQYLNSDGSITLRLAQDFSQYSLTPSATGGSINRIQAGDLTHDFSQDIAISRAGTDNNSGTIELYDGASLLNKQTKQLSSLQPYSKSTIAPWAFIEDFTGDGKRDLVTAGFKGDTINLSDLQIKAWTSKQNGQEWSQAFKFDPFDHIDTHLHTDDGHQMPKSDLTADQVSVAMADMNLDNFQDIAITYAIQNGGIRFVVLDGAALSLNYQTNTMEGGYFPDDNVLVDAFIDDPALDDLSNIVLTAGFSSYAQSALEDVIITAESEDNNRKTVFTTQLQAGHFIATSEMDESDDGGSHAGHGMPAMEDERVINQRDNSMPLQIVETQNFKRSGEAATPIIHGVFGTTGLVIGDELVIAQGISNQNGEYSYGNSSSSQDLFNTSQQLALNLDGLNRVNRKDLSGITGSDLDSTYNSQQTQKRVNVTNLLYFAYTGQTMAPSDLANAAGAELGGGASAQELALDLLDGEAIKPAMTTNFGNGKPLVEQSVKDIVTGTTKNLFHRQPSKEELARWNAEVDSGLDKSLLPLAVLQAVDGDDVYRTGLVSAIAQWNQAQWSTNAVQNGAFGQGLRSDKQRFGNVTEKISDIGIQTGWDSARDAFSTYTEETLDKLIGTEISKSGFF